ncbi:MAG: NAD-dependent epimerase/dehydratase family protein [Burkholderiales bacterium]
MHVLVTGSAGRVGRRVVQLLRARGDTVTGFDRVALARDDAGYREVLGHFEDPDAVTRAIEGADAVLHLGAHMSWLPKDASDVYAANATGTFHLAAASAARKVRRFVLASSGEVFPEVRPRYLPVDEDHPREPLSVYGLSKALAEDIVLYFHRAQALRYVVLRFSHTQDASELIDPDSFFSGPRFYLRSKIRQQQLFGNTRALTALEPLDDGTPKHLVQCGEDGTPYRMMIADARDIADGVVLALDAPRAENTAMALGPDEATSFDAAVESLQRVTGLAVVTARMPGPAVDYATSNARARELLGFRPRWTFEQMVDDAANGRASPRR